MARLGRGGPPESGFTGNVVCVCRVTVSGEICCRSRLVFARGLRPLAWCGEPVRGPVSTTVLCWSVGGRSTPDVRRWCLMSGAHLPDCWAGWTCLCVFCWCFCSLSSNSANMSVTSSSPVGRAFCLSLRHQLLKIPHSGRRVDRGLQTRILGPHGC